MTAQLDAVGTGDPIAGLEVVPVALTDDRVALQLVLRHDR
jgi:hypothetical protein